MRAIEQHDAPTQQPAARQGILTLAELTDVVIDQRFKFMLTVLRMTAKLIDKVTP
ncbi:hypothetical protein [Klebsiella pneumoniae IS10]|nr:hypothetical protein [Klebsiella pneumoniae IS10]VXZ84044.1 Uncharacterised protein [Klebsiella pneumoniae]